MNDTLLDTQVLIAGLVLTNLSSEAGRYVMLLRRATSLLLFALGEEQRRF